VFFSEHSAVTKGYLSIPQILSSVQTVGTPTYQTAFTDLETFLDFLCL